MIQFVKEDLFIKMKVEKIATIVLLTVRGVFENGQQYPSISTKGKATPLDVSDVSRKIATSFKSL